MAIRAHRALHGGWGELGTGEGDEGGDTGGKDDEEQTHDHLIGGFGIVLLPIPDKRPARPHIHQPQTEKADDCGNRGDDLGGASDIGEQLLNGIG